MILAVNFFESVTSFFSSIGEFFNLVGKVISNTMYSLIHAINFLLTAQFSLSVVINYLPAIVSGACFAFVAVGVLRFVFDGVFIVSFPVKGGSSAI